LAWNAFPTWLALGGSILLGLVFALLTARKPERKQAIAVEDFVGGFIIGALAGLFSQQVLDKLAALLK
jgi:xanthosine utilization system XapX-like protein